MGKKIEIPRDNNIIKVPIEEAMPDNYLPYAVEVAKDRALPDVRDGLKPVHRRILYGAYMLRAFPDKPYYKSARIVGDILGKYHPHGDSSVYDAMVILAQKFSTRLPLIDGHGNWGSQDGDNAAAMRYTEARLTPAAMELLRDIDKGVVEMVDNYSSSELEPKVLPARYPNLLVNGTFGIAVGIATNIPPHNLNEVINATLAQIDNKDITTKELMKYIKAPDLPTGGILIGKNALLSAYETGVGRVTLRSKTNIEKLDSGRFAIVITEFPYRRNKAKLLQTISEMTGDKKHAKALEAIIDIRDESDRTGIRSVIEMKKSINEATTEKILKYLFKKTDLQCNISFNMVALSNGKPEIMGIKTILRYYIDHQKEVVTLRTKRELEIALKRFHVVEGFIKAIDIIGEIILVIRGSKSKKDSEKNIMEKFGFTQIQAEAIVELMLYKLTGLEIKIFEKEYKELEKEIKGLKKILESEKELLKVIKDQLIEIRDRLGNARRTQIIEDDDEAKIDLEELLVVEDTMVTLSNDGFIKRIPLKSYNRSNTNVEDIDYREGDFNKQILSSNTKDIVMIFTDKGNMYQIKGIGIPEFKWKEKGERIDSLIKGLDLAKEKIICAYSISSFLEQKDFIFFTSKGSIKKTGIDKFDTAHSKIQALKLKEEQVIDVSLIDKEREEGFIKVKTKNELEFSLEEPKLEAADRNILGMELVKLSSNNEIINIEYTKEYEFKTFGASINNNGIIKIHYTSKNHANSSLYVQTDSGSKLILFAEDGMAYFIPSCMIENLQESGINIKELLPELKTSNKKIIKIISIKEFSENISLFFFSKKGMIKKTLLSELEGVYSSTIVYKLKGDNDGLINVVNCYNISNKDIVLVTKKAMCIRFDNLSINLMGKVASGVTGISLKEDDEVIFGDLIVSECSTKNEKDEIAVSKITKKEVTLVTNNKNKKLLALNDIKVQNRAGRGSNMMLVAIDEYVLTVKSN